MKVYPPGEDIKIFPIKNLKEILIGDLKKNVGVNGKKKSRFLRFEYGTETVDPLIWLRSQNQKEKLYFKGRGNNDPEIAMSGSARMIKSRGKESLKTVFMKIKRELADGLRFYGGIAFSRPGTGSEEWDSFGRIKFVLPRFEYILKENGPVFAANYLCSELNSKNIDSLISEVEDLVFSNFKGLGKIRKSTFGSYIPDFNEWKLSVSDYLERIDDGEIDKIVAARRIDVKSSSDPFKIVDDLRKSGDYCTDFLVSFDSESFFIGSTPERLFRKEGDLLITESVAGTAPRGDTEFDDYKFGSELLASEKEELEHNLVTEDIVRKLDKICKPIGISERVLLKLSTLQHLYKRISGKIKPGVFDGEILESLFPTPAVSGFPVKKSLKILSSIENFDRGWYSGLVGFTGIDVSDYYVSIRSMLVRENNIYVYSGAGIVKGSDPEKEWEETSLKAEKFRKILKYEI